MPFCCSADVVGNFAYANSRKEVERYIRDMLKTRGSYDLVLATTVSSQTSAVLTLKKLRFHQLRTWVGGYGNEVTLWGRQGMRKD